MTNQPVRTKNGRLEIGVVREEVIETDTVFDSLLQEILFVEEKDDGAIAEETIVPHQIERRFRFEQPIGFVVFAQLQTKITAEK